ncbi:MAG: enoyl-CoA hydratase/isomerase family protein [Actinomycetota bacterium]|nr:enoyl-CoA hydratase/isomerase family protein [Actinomycetota bacterium]
MSLVGYERSGTVALVRLQRPEKLNALDAGMVGELSVALDRAASDEDARVVVLCAEGRAFCAGYDLGEELAEAEVGAEAWRRSLSRDVEATMKLWSLAKPTIAAVRGHCLGGGCELAMACDLVVAAADARFGEPEIRYGSGPVTLLMPFVLGQKKTFELLYTGDVLDAESAAGLGLVNRVVDGEELEHEAVALAERIALAPPAALKLTKVALVRAFEAMGLRQAVGSNLDISAILNASDSPEQQQFDRLAREQGLRAALAWRDARYDGAPGA